MIIGDDVTWDLIRSEFMVVCRSWCYSCDPLCGATSKRKEINKSNGLPKVNIKLRNCHDARSTSMIPII
jgi:hypothetical protein